MNTIISTSSTESINIQKMCPLCGDIYEINLTPDETARYRKYCEGKGYIQELLYTLNPVEREFIKSGYCPVCQKAIFDNDKTDRIGFVKSFNPNDD